MQHRCNAHGSRVARTESANERKRHADAIEQRDGDAKPHDRKANVGHPPAAIDQPMRHCVHLIKVTRAASRTPRVRKLKRKRGQHAKMMVRLLNQLVSIGRGKQLAERRLQRIHLLQN